MEPEPGQSDGSGSSQIPRLRAAPAPKPCSFVLFWTMPKCYPYKITWIVKNQNPISLNFSDIASRCGCTRSEHSRNDNDLMINSSFSNKKYIFRLIPEQINKYRRVVFWRAVLWSRSMTRLRLMRPAPTSGSGLNNFFVQIEITNRYSFLIEVK